MKRGQITLFVIIGIVIIGLLAAVYYLRSSFVKTVAEKKAIEEAELTVEESNIKNLIEDCIADVAEDSILYTAARGGYYQPPSRTEPFNNVEIPYYLHKNDKNVPSIEKLEEQIALYIDANLEGCIAESAAFLNSEILEKPKSMAKLTDTGLSIETEMPVRMGIESERRINFFSSQIDTKYRQVYNDAIEAYDKLKIIDNFLFVDLSELALNKDYEMRTAIDEDKIITLLLYKNYKVKETPLRFNFAIMHDSEKRIKADDVYSQNSLTEIVKTLQGLFALNEITSDDDYEAEEAKYENRIMQSIQNNPGGAK